MLDTCLLLLLLSRENLAGFALPGALGSLFLEPLQIAKKGGDISHAFP